MPEPTDNPVLAGRGRVRRVILQHGQAKAQLDPEYGGRLGSLTVAGHELLETGTSNGGSDRARPPMSWGAFPMVPWAGRVNRGAFRFDGRPYQLPVTPIPGTSTDHAIHGTSYLQQWQVEDDQTDDAQPRGAQSISQTIAVDLDPAWPFGGRVTHQAVLNEDSLRLTLSLTAGEVAMPAMVGWHPWFRRRLSEGGPTVQLSFEAALMAELDGEAIPTGNLVSPPPGPWDNCFSGLSDPPVLRWPGQLEVRLESDCSHWVIYDRPEHALCIEPQSGVPDCFNQFPNSLDHRLESGQSLTRTFTISWTLLEQP